MEIHKTWLKKVIPKYRQGSKSQGTLEHPQQMWDMCQMLNIWHISHTKPSLNPFIRCCKCNIFCNMLQYNHKFATVR